MDRRRSFRQPVVLTLELIHRYRSLGHFTTGDVSLGGMFLVTPWLGIVPKDMVELCWYAPEPRILNGIVVHRSVKGLGLKVEDYPLEALLRHAAQSHTEHSTGDAVAEAPPYPSPRQLTS